jgi:hypothetical protein
MRFDGDAPIEAPRVRGEHLPRLGRLDMVDVDVGATTIEVEWLYPKGNASDIIECSNIGRKTSSFIE